MTDCIDARTNRMKMTLKGFLIGTFMKSRLNMVSNNHFSRRVAQNSARRIDLNAALEPHFIKQPVENQTADSSVQRFVYK